MVHEHQRTAALGSPLHGLVHLDTDGCSITGSKGIDVFIDLIGNGAWDRVQVSQLLELSSSLGTDFDDVVASEVDRTSLESLLAYWLER